MSLHPGLFYPTSSSGSGFCSLLLVRSLPLPPSMDRIRLPAAPGCFTPRNAGFHRIGDVRGLEVTTSGAIPATYTLPRFVILPPPQSSPLATSPPDSSCPSALFLVQHMAGACSSFRFGASAISPYRMGFLCECIAKGQRKERE